MWPSILHQSVAKINHYLGQSRAERKCHERTAKDVRRSPEKRQKNAAKSTLGRFKNTEGELTGQSR